MPSPVDLIRGFHIEPTNICTLKCPGCARTRFIQQWPQHWNNHSVDVDVLMNFLDIDISGKTMLLCGNYGDPIYHKDFIKLVDKFKQRGAVISIITNGSYKDKNWWEELTARLDATDTVTFSIDGLPENFTQYRINADWVSISEAIKVCVSAMCGTAWKYIPFSYNQNNIDQARALSTELGIDNFELSYSDRFDQETQHLIPLEHLTGERLQAQTDFKNGGLVTEITPKCDQGAEHYISADGHYMPCCYIGDHRFYYKTNFGKNKKIYNIHETTLSQLLAQPTVVEFYQNLNKWPVCQYSCPKTL